MAEWYRGIAVGGPGASSSDVHDFGAGTYLTDDMDVAKDYAKFRSSDANLKENQRTTYPAVLYGNISDEQLGSVLDLTSGEMGAAWREFEETQMATMTNRQIMTTNPGQYGPMFRGWAANRGLNLNSYAAVIGPEYLRGGKQMCIRNPAVADSILGNFVGRSIYAPAPGFQPPTVAEITYSARGQANASASLLAFMVVDGLLHYLNDRFLEAEVRLQVMNIGKSIREWQRQYPADGALVAITFKRIVPSSDLMAKTVLLHAGDSFEYYSIYYAAKLDDAIKQMQQERELLQGDVIDGPYATTRRKQCHWVNPLAPVADVLLLSPKGKWQVAIGDWKGFFTFDGNGRCAWNDSGMDHTGKWSVVGNEVQWTYDDDPPGWERIFHASLPMHSKVDGAATIKGVNHGFYSMTKIA
ncbi:hypothetical protein JQ615_12000 [Bradyrhizobium jicamae]|uniref:Uncharacterized protein n=1 Tax=Bradyrhizobium jicamae TaxID=280332 RepID=A0ABS5FH43_9BRAD|nr:hypothetical protein [Bradyrhizobium jicamae]MBR0796112.1 hypothetical protein [Bradyrhizobium jicamae]